MILAILSGIIIGFIVGDIIWISRITDIEIEDYWNNMRQMCNPSLHGQGGGLGK